MRQKRLFVGLFLVSFFVVQGFAGFWGSERSLFAKDAIIPVVQIPSRDKPSGAAELMQQGRELYAVGNYSEAIALLQQALATFQGEADVLRQAMVLSNLSLAYQKLGAWTEAEQAVTESLKLLQAEETSGNLPKEKAAERLQILAQTLGIHGSLQLSQGQPEQALTTWQQATVTYEQAGNQLGAIGSRVNQTQAMLALGLYRRALTTLKELGRSLQNQPDSLTKAIGLRSLGDALQLVGDLDQSEAVLQQSREIAQRLKSPLDVSAALFSLGNALRAQYLSDPNSQQPSLERALTFYQQAAQLATSPTTKAQAQLNQLSLLVETRPTEAQVLASQIQSELATLPPNRTAVYARINLAQSLIELSGVESVEAIEQLTVAVEQARRLKDQRALAHALGNLGGLSEKTGQLSRARDLTEEALLLAQTINAPDVSYRWQWQLGRILRVQGDRNGAIAAYTSAVNILKDLRGDLVSINPDVQFSFRESVEPVYRELVSLLLDTSETQANQDNLAQARLEIEALQQAELVNFFREDCLNAIPAKIDQIDQQAAVIYPIVLEDRLEVVLSLPNQPLRHYAVRLPQATVEAIFTRLRAAISPDQNDPRGLGVTAAEDCRASLAVEGSSCFPSQPEPYLPLAQQVYDWLIRPFASEIAQSKAKTLVFVLDGPLLNLPMAVLNDGEEFLVENYAIALTPGLQLLDPKPLLRGKLTALKAGLTEARDGFIALPYVDDELTQIEVQVPGELLLNQDFTNNAIQNAIDSVPFPVVHLATHGQFSSNAEETFILTWDKRLNVNEINTLLRTRENKGREAIELLVLSACQTATGDKRAALGLAGIAIRAGARSTVATLWSVSDAATAELMVRFYQELADTTTTKAEALRRAQVELLKGQYSQPIYWAPYVLVGNWL